MRIDPAALVKSIGDLDGFDLADGLAASVQHPVEEGQEHG